jgi:predicted porin
MFDTKHIFEDATACSRACFGGRVNMKGVQVVAASAAVVVMLGGTVSAWAADLDIKAPVLKAPVADAAVCTTIMDFFATACQVAAYGVRFYGTINLGFAYQTNGSTFSKIPGAPINFFAGKGSHGAKWLLAPNGLTQSNVGFQIKEPLGAGWSFVGQVETGFNPMTFTIANSVLSVAANRGIPLGLQTTNGDSNTQGTFYNSQGYAGVSSDTWGTLTFGRQNTLMADAVAAYDPMQSSYAFSVLGYYGGFAGGGNTENRKATTSAKYRVNYGNVHAGVFGQFGSYEEGNASKGQILGDIGADFDVGPGVFSTDVVGGYTRDGVNLILIGPTNSNGYPINTLTSTNQVLTAQLSNNKNVMVTAKYTVDKLRLYAGYEWIQFANPSDPVNSFTDIAGTFICAGCNTFNFTNINNTSYTLKDKILQIVWAGARYAVTDSLEVAAAYYHQEQNNYTNLDCTIATAHAQCAGTMDAASALIDWRFAPKWDTYIGTQYAQSNGGLNSGYLSKNNATTTAGVRFRW